MHIYKFPTYIVAILSILTIGCARMESRIHNAQSHAAYEKGDYAAATRATEKGLDLARRQLGEKHPDTLSHMNNLAYLYRVQGQYGKAEALHLETLKLRNENLGARHHDTLTSMNNLAAVYKDQGKYPQAEKLFHEVLLLRTEKLGENNPQTLNTMGNLAGLYVLLGKLAEARELHLKALKIRTELLGEQDKDTVSSMIGLAEIYKLEANYEAAEALYREALAIDKRHLGERHPITLLINNNLAGVYQAQGRYAAAESLFQATLTARKAILGERHPDTLGSMNNLALLYLEQGHYSKAEPLLAASLAKLKDVLGNYHPTTLAIMDNLGTALRVTGQYKQADDLLNETLVLRKRILGKDDQATLVTMNNLALLYQAMGQYDSAESLYVEVLSGRKQKLGPEHLSTLTSMNNLAFLYSKQGRFKKAEDLFAASHEGLIKILGEAHPDTLVNMANLAGIYMDQGQYWKAEKLLEKTLRLRAEILGKNHPDTIGSMNDLSVLYSKLFRFERALDVQQEVVGLIHVSKGANHPDTLLAMNNLAYIYQALGQMDNAESLYTEILQAREKVLGEAHPDTLLNRFNLAELYLETDRLNLAFDQLRKHLEFSNQYLKRILWSAGEITRQSYISQQNDARNLYLSVFSELATTQSNREFWNVSITRKGQLLAIASEVSVLTKLQQSTDPQIKEMLGQFNHARMELASLTFSDAAAQAKRGKLQELMNGLERQLSSKVEHLRVLQQDATPEAISHELSNKQVLIDFLVFNKVKLRTLDYQGEQVYAAIASSNAKLRLVNLGPLGPIAKLIYRYRKAIEPWAEGEDWFYSEKRKRVLNNTAVALYRKLWQPLEPHLEGKNQVFLIPDGVLNLVPFKALIDDTGGFLLDKYDITRLSSARDLLFSVEAASVGTSAIVSNPLYGAQTNMADRSIGRSIQDLSFIELPGTKIEGESIRAIMKSRQHPVTLFSEGEATEKKLNALQSPFVLHLATHGFYLENILATDMRKSAKEVQRLDSGKFAVTNVTNPLARSGLALASANSGIIGEKQQDGTDGLFTALEVLNLDLRGTQLVVLSACETGVGEIDVGEGVYSLNRAFQEAGAKTVLSTLWSISDDGTNEFMQRFYNRFLKNLRSQAALQTTQQEFKNNVNWQDPFFWAPFVMVGQ